MWKRFGRKKQQRQQRLPPSNPPPSQTQQPSLPPPTKSLFELLNHDPDDDDEKSKYDDRAVIEQVRRHPNDTQKKYTFTAYLINGDKYKGYPLNMAVMLGCSLEAVEVLYEANPDAIQHKDECGYTVLHRACRYKVSLEVATFLVEKYPAAFEMKVWLGRTPLHYACRWGAPLEVVGMLLDKYPPALNMKDDIGDTPLMLTKWNHASPFVLELLREAEHRERSLFASRGSDLSKLLDLHPVNQRAEYDEEAVLTAARRDPSAAKEKYIFAACQYHFLYPLTMAVAVGASLEVVKLIYDAHREAIQSSDTNGQTPIHYGHQYDASVDVEVFLLEKQLDVKDETSRTVLHVACQYDVSVDVMKVLLDKYPIPLDAKDNDGQTVLHVACRYKASFEVIEFLAKKHPAAKYIEDNYKKNPSTLAKENEASPRVLDIFKEAQWESSRLLNLHPVNQRSKYNDEAILKAIRRDPDAAKEKYRFPAYDNSCLFWPLTVAVALGASLQVVEELYNVCNVAIRDTGNIGQSVLHVAARYKASDDVVKFLLDKHPSAVETKDDNGKTPWMLAKENNASVEVIQILRNLFVLLNLHPIKDKTLYDNEAVLKAIRRDPQAAKQQCTFPAYDDSRKFYPLTVAVALGASVEVVEELYNACNVAIRDVGNNGQTVLHVACQYKALPQVAAFLADKYPSALDEKNNLGQIPLHVACYWGAPAEVLKILVERSPNSLNSEDRHGKTPYMLAKETNEFSEVKQILTAKTAKRTSQAKEEEQTRDMGTTEKRRPSKIAIPKNICIATKQLRLGDKIGKGAFAEVFEGKYKRRGHKFEVVAFKQFKVKESELSDNDTTSIERELGVLQSFQLHENVVTLLGACSDLEAIDANGRKVGFGMMMELADLGSLRKYLVNLNTDDEPRALQSILLDTARGMLALHSQRPYPIIHRDLKSMNILLFSVPSSEAGVVAKISDFGLARAVTNSSAATTTKGVGTPNWMAPETIMNKYNEDTDVWSFGMVIYEVATGNIPYDGIDAVPAMWKIMKGELPDLSKIRPGFPDATTTLMKECCSLEAKERPRFGAIVERLSDLLGTEQTALHSLRGGSLEDRLELQRKLLELKAQLDKQAAEDARKYKEAWASLSTEEGTEEALQALSSFAAQRVGSARQPERISSVDDLMADAKACKQDMHDAMREVVEAAGGTFIAAGLKGRDRVEHKTNRDYDGDCRRVVDVVRATGLFDSLSQVKAIVKLLENCDSLTVIRCKDRLNRPLSSGYRDILVNVVQSKSDGPSHVAELQVHLRVIQEIKEVHHRVYELQRLAGWVPE